MSSMRSSPGESEIFAIISEFNRRPDHLTAILKYCKGLKGNLGYIYIATIEASGKHVLIMYHPPPEEKEIEYKLYFDPPVKSVFDVRGRLYNMRREALQHFQVPAKPVISYYSRPEAFPFTVPIVLLLALLFFSLFGQGHYADLWRSKVAEKSSPQLIYIAAFFTVFMHLTEPAYMVYVLRQHKTPFFPALKWVLTVMALGYAGINEWNESVEWERMRNIYRKTDVGELPPRVPIAITEEKKKQ